VALTTAFGHWKGLGASPFRAYADVQMFGPAGVNSSIIQCLVDTGSDYTILPLAIASSIGIQTTGTPIVPVTFRTAGGVQYTLPLHPAVDIRVEGYRIQVPVVFSPAAFSPIVGRQELLAAFDLGFDTGQWYWD
jgi:predicted aspartyl protease